MRKYVIPTTVAAALFIIEADAAPRNLIRDASFEAGAGPSAWAVTFAATERLTQKNLDASTAVHGKASLQLPVLRGELFSAPIAVPEAGEYVFSAFVKASAPVRVRLAIQTEGRRDLLAYKDFQAGSEWAQFEMKQFLPKTRINVRIGSTEPRPEARMWVDAVLLAPVADGRAEPTAYLVEAGLTCDAPAKAFYAEEPASVDVHLANYTAKPVSARFLYTVTDLYGRRSDVKAFDLGPVGAGASKAAPLRLDASRRGLFSLRGRLEGQDKDTTEICYLVIPKPPEHTILAAHMSLNRPSMEALSRVGVRWYESLTDSIHRLQNMRPEKDRFVWFDEQADMIPEYGMQAIGVLEYFFNRGDFSWAKGHLQTFDPPVVMRGRVLETANHVRPDVWEDHCRRIFTHYRKQIRNWVIDDENDSWPPEAYLDVLRRTHDTARSVDPGLRVATSANVHWFQEMKDLGGAEVFDAIGGSIGNAPYWSAKKSGWFARKYKKDVWVTGIFGRSASFYHLNVPRSDWLRRATSMYRSTMRCFYLHRASSVAPYIYRLAIFSMTNTMSLSGFDFDASIKPHGVGFLMAGDLFGEMSDVEELNVEVLEPDQSLAFGFTKRGRSGVALAGYGAKVRLDVKRSQVEALDWFENPLEESPVDKGNIEAVGDQLDVVLGERPIYLYGRGLSAEALRRAVRRASVAPQVETREMFLVRDGKLGRASLQVNRTVNASDGLQPGQAKIVRFTSQENPDPKRPLENRKGCWLANGLRAATPVKVDGRLDEWRGRSACWMYVCWWANGPPSRHQMHILKGGEFINYQPWYDFKVGFRASYDDRNLYFAFKVNDDDIAPGNTGNKRDGVRIRLDTRILEDLGSGAASGDDFVIEADLGDARSATAALARSTGERVPVKVAAGEQDRGYVLEMAIPLSALGLKSVSMQAVGLSVVAGDADYDADSKGDESFKREYSELRWPGDAPLGTLLFVENNR